MSEAMDKAVVLAVSSFDGTVVESTEADVKEEDAMEMLPNGAVVIARDEDIVLCFWDKAWGREYITWKGSTEGGYYSGHYFLDIYAAAQNFAERRRG